MSQIWALIATDGSYVFRYTDSAEQHPEDCGEAEACLGCLVVAIPREPVRALGETLSPSGLIIFDLADIQPGLVAEIKAEAGRRIISLVPLWRQINDLDIPTDPAAIARKQSVSAIRDWSNQLEAQLDDATSAEDIQVIREELS